MYINSRLINAETYITNNATTYQTAVIVEFSRLFSCILESW